MLGTAASIISSGLRTLSAAQSHKHIADDARHMQQQTLRGRETWSNATMLDGGEGRKFLAHRQMVNLGFTPVEHPRVYDRLG